MASNPGCKRYSVRVLRREREFHLFLTVDPRLYHEKQQNHIKKMRNWAKIPK